MPGIPLFANTALAVATIVAEAGNQPLSGQIAVAEVIRNRTERRYASDGSIAGTVFKPWQFSCFGDGTPWRARIFKLTWADLQVQEAFRAWLTAHAHVDGGQSERSDVAKGAVLYHTIQAPVVKGKPVPWPPKWATAPGVVEVARIGDHVFYDDRNGRKAP
jgi:spore germination cell wall hydrolase CwlJ-like protein